jgi:cystathionine beta-lyase
MNFEERTDALTIEHLRSLGGTKWSSPDGEIGAFVAEMDFGIDPHITAALHKIVEDGSFGYMPRSFTEELSAATASFLHRRYGWKVAPADVLAVPDVIMALELAMEHCSRPGSKIIVPTPAYMPFLMVPPLKHREVIEVPMKVEGGGYVFDLEALQRAYDDGGDLLILCNPYNPVGRVFERDELVAVSELVDRNNGHVFSDEIWAPLTYPGAIHIPYASLNEVAAAHGITAISASKAWNLPGLKCAQLILSNDHDRATFEKVGMFAGHGTSNLGAIANAVAYREGEPWLDKTVSYLLGNRDRLVELVASELPGAHMHTPEGTYVAWIDFTDADLPTPPAEFFKEHAGVLLTEGTMCGEAGQGFVRLIFATPRPILEQIIRTMGTALREGTSRHKLP